MADLKRKMLVSIARVKPMMISEGFYSSEA